MTQQQSQEDLEAELEEAEAEAGIEREDSEEESTEESAEGAGSEDRRGRVHRRVLSHHTPRRGPVRDGPGPVVVSGVLA